MVSIAVAVVTSCSCVVGFKEMLEAPNVRQSGKKHSKHSTSAAPNSTAVGGTPFTVPVIASATQSSTMNHRDMSSGLSGGNRAAKIRRALAKFNLLPSSTSRYCITLIYSCCYLISNVRLTYS